MTELRTDRTAPVVVGISVSEPSGDELVRLGLSEMHLRHSFVEIIRHVLALGGSVAYGGDLRQAGYTEVMLDLIRTYDRADLSGPDRVFSYLAWPIWQGLSVEDRSALVNVATLREVQRPPGAPEELPPPDARGPVELRWGSVAMTKMRTEMNSELDARVILGGRTFGQMGYLPGVAEEAVLALESEVPLYVAGGFGGCGRVVAAALLGEAPIELSVAYQLEHTARYELLLDANTPHYELHSLDDVVEVFASRGVAGLRNGLNEAENLRLFVTDDVDEIVGLLLRGLREITRAQ